VKDFIRFEIHCGTCGQQLAMLGVTEGLQLYGHENSSDCSDGTHQVVVPEVSVEQLIVLFTPKTAKKTAPKKTPKK
jgi:hypothetical protein